MRQRALTLAMLLGLAGLAGAAREAGPPTALAGLLSPAVVADGPPGCQRIDPATRLPLHESPASSSRRVGLLAFRPWRAASGDCDEVLPFLEPDGGDAAVELPHFESSYEVLALAVLQRRAGWLQLHLGGTAAWLQLPTGYRFEAYPDLLVGKLAYATPAWTGEICSTAGEHCRRMPTTTEQALQVLSVMDKSGQAWLQVELTTDPCHDGDARVLQRGWLRARDGDARPTAWFHSRGC